jgi:hypothetical protein
MTEYTRPATWDDLIALGRALEDAGARYALIGGYAISAHCYQRFSEDIDILVDPSPDNTPRWVEALSSLPDGAAKELAGDPEVFEREGHYAIRINDGITIDVMPSACGHGWAELSPYSITDDPTHFLKRRHSALYVGLPRIVAQARRLARRARRV